AGAGVVSWAGTPGRPGGALEIHFEKPGLRLVSIQGLAVDSSGDVFVALEATNGGGGAVDFNKTGWRDFAGGTLVAETTDLPLDYYVRPTDEIRVHKGQVFQLMTTSSEVRINIWDTN